ncbi:hypothetical protein H257_09302 [Aphanomyces astaci]|uniref:Uncharacterized protein n=1 Tax=Aphanomyces astaci TaxID=112090 RepID=W4GB15_APHAT|nr:hypothetical protein H257_09302 [Aphanomyces astaci]ETV76865.1 hypothetical protein H257_09302 [Aphanomyces astaci]|eukprot:XP_009833777.1 hypothetical protein H257_09302 [Aphanomyces astaci]
MCVRLWVQIQRKLASFKGSKTRKKNTCTCGGRSIIPDSHDLVTYLKDLRRSELPMTSSHVLKFLRAGHAMRRICRQKKTQVDPEETCLAFGKKFHSDHPGVAMDCVYNVDETGIHYDILVDSGKKLPIVFVIRGVDGGTIETKVFNEYPSGHFYAIVMVGDLTQVPL